MPEAAHLVIYNSGSFLNPEEMPADLRDEILVWTRSLPALRMVSLETREDAVSELSLRRAADALGPDRMARVILGLETSDDHLREELLAKQMPRAALRRAVEAIGSAAADLGTERIGLTFNILVGGPGTTLQTAVDDALATARFALEIGRAANLPVDLNLHPYYQSARGRSHFPAHASCSPRTVALVAPRLRKGRLALFRRPRFSLEPMTKVMIVNWSRLARARTRRAKPLRSSTSHRIHPCWSQRVRRRGTGRFSEKSDRRRHAAKLGEPARGTGVALQSAVQVIRGVLGAVPTLFAGMFPREEYGMAAPSLVAQQSGVEPVGVVAGIPSPASVTTSINSSTPSSGTDTFFGA